MSEMLQELAVRAPAQAAEMLQSMPAEDMVSNLAVLHNLCERDSNSPATLEILSNLLQRAICGASTSNPQMAQYALPFDQQEKWLSWHELHLLLSVPHDGTVPDLDLDRSKDAPVWGVSDAVRAGAISMLVALTSAVSHQYVSGGSSSDMPSLSRCRMNCARSLWALCMTGPQWETTIREQFVEDGGLQMLHDLIVLSNREAWIRPLDPKVLTALENTRPLLSAKQLEQQVRNDLLNSDLIQNAKLEQCKEHEEATDARVAEHQNDRSVIKLQVADEKEEKTPRQQQREQRQLEKQRRQQRWERSHSPTKVSVRKRQQQMQEELALHVQQQKDQQEQKLQEKKRRQQQQRAKQQAAEREQRWHEVSLREAVVLTYASASLARICRSREGKLAALTLPVQTTGGRTTTTLALSLASLAGSAQSMVEMEVQRRQLVRQIQAANSVQLPFRGVGVKSSCAVVVLSSVSECLECLSQPKYTVEDDKRKGSEEDRIWTEAFSQMVQARIVCLLVVLGRSGSVAETPALVGATALHALKAVAGLASRCARKQEQQRLVEDGGATCMALGAQVAVDALLNTAARMGEPQRETQLLALEWCVEGLWRMCKVAYRGTRKGLEERGIMQALKRLQEKCDAIASSARSDHLRSRVQALAAPIASCMRHVELSVVDAHRHEAVALWQRQWRQHCKRTEEQKAALARMLQRLWRSTFVSVAGSTATDATVASSGGNGNDSIISNVMNLSAGARLSRLLLNEDGASTSPVSRRLRRAALHVLCRYLDKRGASKSSGSCTQTAMRQAWPVLVQLYKQKAALGNCSQVSVSEGRGRSEHGRGKGKEWDMGEGWEAESWRDQALLVGTMARCVACMAANKQSAHLLLTTEASGEATASVSNSSVFRLIETLSRFDDSSLTTRLSCARAIRRLAAAAEDGVRLDLQQMLRSLSTINAMFEIETVSAGEGSKNPADVSIWGRFREEDQAKHEDEQAELDTEKRREMIDTSEQEEEKKKEEEQRQVRKFSTPRVKSALEQQQEEQELLRELAMFKDLVEKVEKPAGTDVGIKETVDTRTGEAKANMTEEERLEEEWRKESEKAEKAETSANSYTQKLEEDADAFLKDLFGFDDNNDNNNNGVKLVADDTIEAVLTQADSQDDPLQAEDADSFLAALFGGSYTGGSDELDVEPEADERGRGGNRSMAEALKGGGSDATVLDWKQESEQLAAAFEARRLAEEAEEQAQAQKDLDSDSFDEEDVGISAELAADAADAKVLRAGAPAKAPASALAPQKKTLSKAEILLQSHLQHARLVLEAHLACAAALCHAAGAAVTRRASPDIAELVAALQLSFRSAGTKLRSLVDTAAGIAEGPGAAMRAVHARRLLHGAQKHWRHCYVHSIMLCCTALHTLCVCEIRSRQRSKDLVAAGGVALLLQMQRLCFAALGKASDGHAQEVAVGLGISICVGVGGHMVHKEAEKERMAWCKVQEAVHGAIFVLAGGESPMGEDIEIGEGAVAEVTPGLVAIFMKSLNSEVSTGAVISVAGKQPHPPNLPASAATSSASSVAAVAASRAERGRQQLLQQRQQQEQQIVGLEVQFRVLSILHQLSLHHPAPFKVVEAGILDVLGGLVGLEREQISLSEARGWERIRAALEQKLCDESSGSRNDSEDTHVQLFVAEVIEALANEDESAKCMHMLSHGKQDGEAFSVDVMQIIEKLQKSSDAVVKSACASALNAISAGGRGAEEVLDGGGLSALLMMAMG